MLLIIPIIPILAIVAIFGGGATLIWYYNQPKSKQDRANQLALKWFGKRFNELAEYQQLKIKNELKQLS